MSELFDIVKNDLNLLIPEKKLQELAGQKLRVWLSLALQEINQVTAEAKIAEIDKRISEVITNHPEWATLFTPRG